MNPQRSKAKICEPHHHILSPQMARAYFCGSDTVPMLSFTTLAPKQLRNFLLMTLALPLQEQSFMQSSQVMEMKMYFSSEAS
jgi:hypothetical protein